MNLIQGNDECNSLQPELNTAAKSENPIGGFYDLKQKKVLTMKRLVLLLACLSLIAGSALSQEVVIPDFPVGVAGGAGNDFLKPYHNQLKAIADSLKADPMARAIITGGADGSRFAKNNDAINPALALGRAHFLRRYIIDEFGVDSSRLIIQSEDAKAKGGNYRYAKVRLDGKYSDLLARLEAIENQTPIEKHFTEIREVTNNHGELLGLRFGVGLSSSPYGGIPLVTGAVTWQNLVDIEGIFGYNFWNGTYRFENTDLDTRLRLIGGQVIVYPKEDLPVGILGGWIRIEEIAQRYYEYVRMSEGLMVGLRWSPLEYLSITGAYNPSKKRAVDDFKSETDYDQFLISVTVHKALGGAK